MPETPWLIILTAQQRSGTGALTRTLDLGTKIHGLPEVFHPNAGSGINFFDYRAQHFGIKPQSPEANVWDGYVSYLRSNHLKPFILLNIKYDSWHHLNGAWHFPNDPPALLGMVKERSVAIIHLIRKDVFAQACSYLVATERGIWQSHKHPNWSPEQDQTRYLLNPRDLLQLIQQSLAGTKLFRELFAGYPRYAELTFEELLENGYLSETATNRISHLIGENCGGSGRVPTKKLILHIRDVVENGDAIVDFFKDTPFADHVSRAFASDSL
jgi:hypothetical protein